jgi:putative oxidoreductase
MRIVAMIARYLLGVMFFVFGLNAFMNFIPQQPMPPGAAGEFATLLMSTHYMLFVGAVEVLCGLMFITNRFVPLALTLLGPILVNILLFHVTMAPKSILPGIITTLLWFLLFWRNRAAFAGIFEPKPSA